MSGNGILPWESLERWRAQLFILGAVVILGGAAVVLYDIGHGTEIRVPLGQVFVGASWTAALVGMLGLYPGLAEHRPWVARASALTAALGVFGYGLMTVVFVAAVGGVPMSSLEPIQPAFFVPFLIGTVLGFPLFAVGGLLTGAYSRAVSLLLAGPTVIFVANVLSGPTAESIIVVQIALFLVFGATGFLLRTESATTERAAPVREPAPE